jgi:phosphatidylinositol-3-phosphatase
MIKKAAIFGLLAAALAGTAWAQKDKDKDDVPKGAQHLDHVFVIIMENHGYQQILNNPNEPYLNSLIASGKVNLATNYFAVGHPSLTNYLEVVGGSNFGVRSDNAPSWHDANCSPNLATGIVNADNGGGNAPVPIDTGTVCPIAGVGQDAETPAIDNWNEVTLPQFPYLADIDGVRSVPAEKTVGKTIGDQLVHVGLSWKSYQEDLPISGADGVNYSNGAASNLTDFSTLAPLTSASVVQAYAVKHNPFAYFKSVQEGTEWNNSLANIVGFDGPRGLYSDLARGDVPSLAFIAPSQCNDQHGRGNGDAFCAFDFGANTSGLTFGTQVGLNPGLIQQGDVTIERLVKSIKSSPVWHDGRTAIVIVWDENDYSGISTQPNGLFPPQNQNKVVLTVETNRDGQAGLQSGTYYNSFSLLRSLEAGFGLPCLNHACDPGVAVMSDLFGR